MKSYRMAVLPGPPQTNEINGLECQPGVTAHTDSKGQSGEVSTPAFTKAQFAYSVAKLNRNIASITAGLAMGMGNPHSCASSAENDALSLHAELSDFIRWLDSRLAL